MKLVLLILSLSNYCSLYAMNPNSDGLSRNSRGVMFLAVDHIDGASDSSFRLSSDSSSCASGSFRLSPDGATFLGEKKPSVLLRRVPSLMVALPSATVGCPSDFGSILLETPGEEDHPLSMHRLSITAVDEVPKESHVLRLPTIGVARAKPLSFLTKQELQAAVSDIDLALNQISYMQRNAYRLLEESIEEDDVLSVFLLLTHCRTLNMTRCDKEGYSLLHNVVRRNGNNMATMVIMIFEYVYRNARANCAMHENPIDVADQALTLVSTRGQIIERTTRSGVTIREGKNSLRFLFENMGQEIARNVQKLSQKAHLKMLSLCSKLRSPVRLEEQDEFFLLKSFARFNPEDHPMFFVAMVLKDMSQAKRAIFSFEGKDMKKRLSPRYHDQTAAPGIIQRKKRVAVEHVPVAVFRIEEIDESGQTPPVITYTSPGEQELTLRESQKERYPKSPYIPPARPQFLPLVPHEPEAVARQKPGSVFRARR